MIHSGPPSITEPCGSADMNADLVCFPVMPSFAACDCEQSSVFNVNVYARADGSICRMALTKFIMLHVARRLASAEWLVQVALDVFNRPLQPNYCRH